MFGDGSGAGTPGSGEPDDELLDGIWLALVSAESDEPWPDVMPLPVVVDELRGWCRDDRQWTNCPPAQWHSLMVDLRWALGEYPDDLLSLAGDPHGLRAEAASCAAVQADKAARAEPAARRRASSLVDALDRLRVPQALAVAWKDLVRRADRPAEATKAARRLVALARWSGYEAESLRTGLMHDLEGHDKAGHRDPEMTATQRLSSATTRIQVPPRAGYMVVWLRLLFAQIPDPGVIHLGAHVTIYSRDALRAIVASPDHPDRPPDPLNDETGWFSTFCRGDEVEDADLSLAESYVRIELKYTNVAGVVPRARLTASTLGAFGALYGAEPKLWQVDASYYTFRDGRRSISTSAAPVAESPTIKERMGVLRDPTAGVLIDHADQLSVHLPIEFGPIADTAELLRWLRDAGASPPPVRLVLCDRAIERTSAWAGVATPDRFVRDHLIPSWAHGQIRQALEGVALAVLHGDLETSIVTRSLLEPRAALVGPTRATRSTFERCFSI